MPTDTFANLGVSPTVSVSFSEPEGDAEDFAFRLFFFFLAIRRCCRPAQPGYLVVGRHNPAWPAGPLLSCDRVVLWSNWRTGTVLGSCFTSWVRLDFSLSNVTVDSTVTLGIYRTRH